MNEDHRSRSRSLPVLLGLMVLAQLTIANEIRFQGCVAREDRLSAVAQAAAGGNDPAVIIGQDCSRVPLL